MFDEKVKDTWKRAEAGAPALSRAEIERLLHSTARWSGRSLEAVAWSYASLLGLAALLAVVNLPGYRGNSTMLAVEGGILVVSVAFAGFSARIIAHLRRIARADLPLVETVERRLQLYDRWFGPWLITGAATPWLLSMAINTLVDNENGTYRVNHPWEFALITAVMVGVTYLMLRVALTPSVRAMQAVLHDLHAEALDATPRIEAVRRRSRMWTAIGVVFLAVGVLFAVLVWLKVI